MAGRDLKFFMREEKEEIVTAPAPEGFTDNEGNPIQLEIKVLPQARIQEIFANYRKRSIATDKRGQPYIGPNNEVIFQSERDSARAVRHIIAEALVYPDLSAPELMKFYNCNDISEMPLKVFRTSEEYQSLSQTVLGVLGLSGAEQQQNEEAITDAKN